MSLGGYLSLLHQPVYWYRLPRVAHRKVSLLRQPLLVRIRASLLTLCRHWLPHLCGKASMLLYLYSMLLYHTNGAAKAGTALASLLLYLYLICVVKKHAVDNTKEAYC